MSKHIASVTQVRNLEEIIDLGGIVKTSQWISGKGKHSTCRAVPPCCARIERKNSPAASKAVQRFFEKNAKVQAVIAVTDRRAANKLIIEKSCARETLKEKEK